MLKFSPAYSGLICVAPRVCFNLQVGLERGFASSVSLISHSFPESLNLIDWIARGRMSIGGLSAAASALVRASVSVGCFLISLDLSLR